MLELLMRLGVVLFMLGSLGAVGLRVTWREAMAALKQPRFLLVSLIASWFVCPVVAMIVLRVVPLAAPYAAGLLLLALAPCAPFAPAVVRIAKGDTSALAAFMVFSAVTTVVFMPVGLALLLEGVAVSPWRIARPLLLFVLTPLACGMAIRHTSTALAARLERVLEMVSATAGLVLLV